MSMLKLMKYEFRKMRTTLLIMFLVLIALEAGFIIGNVIEHDFLPAICLLLIMLLVMAVYVYILISGIVSYSRELKDRTGYLIFMVPVRPISIVVSKLLFTVIAAVLTAVLFGGCAVLDFMYLMEVFDISRAEWAELSISFRVMFADAGMTLTQLVLMIVYMILSVLLEMITTLCTAYLAITLSATVMNNRKSFWRGLMSFGLYVGLALAVSWVSNELLMPEKVADMNALLDYLGIAALFSAAASGLFAWISAVLLKRRVSL